VATTISLSLNNNVRLINVENLAVHSTVAASSAITLTGNAQANMLTGHAGSDTLNGLGGNDTLDGLAGNDRLDGGTGNDLLQDTGGGADVFSFSGAFGSDVVVDQGSNAADVGTLSFAQLTTDQLWLKLDASGNLVVQQLGSANQVTVRNWGQATNQVGKLTAGSGATAATIDAATLQRLATYMGALGTAPAKLADLSASVRADLATLWQGQQLNPYMGTADNDTLQGGSGNDLLQGLAGNDTLSDGAGNDTLDGGEGDDTYYINQPGTTIVDAAAGGTDKVVSSINVDLSVLAPQVEDLSLTGSAAQAVGNALDNVITGNTVASTLLGGAGNDTLNGGADNDVFMGGSGNDQVNLKGGRNLVFFTGDFGQDTVNNATAASPALLSFGGLTTADLWLQTDAQGALTIRQLGTANQVVVPAWLATADAPSVVLHVGTDDFSQTKPRMNAGTLIGGADLIRLVNYMAQLGPDPAPASPSALTAAQQSALAALWNGTLPSGTAGADLLIGSTSSDALLGLAGNDTLRGFQGNDTYDGGDGQDRIEDTGGADVYTLAGNFGADTINDSPTSTSALEGDRMALPGVVAERLWVTHLNDANQSLLVRQLGSANQVTIQHWRDNTGQAAGTGRIEQIDVGNNSVTTFSGDQLDALATAMDKLSAPANSWADLSADQQATLKAWWPTLPPEAGKQINGTGGNDSLTGGTGPDTIKGGSGADLLRGLDGNDSLEGGAGNDILAGGAGNDVLSDTVGGSDIYQFSAGFGHDTITENYDAPASDVDTIAFLDTPYDQLWLTSYDSQTMYWNGVFFVQQLGTDNVVRVNGDTGWRDDSGKSPRVVIDKLIARKGDGYAVLNSDQIWALVNWSKRLPLNVATITSYKDLPANARAELEDLWVSREPQLVVGTAGNDSLVGLYGPDTLRGGAGNDTLFGSAGNDLLEGQDGNDSLVSGAGNDTLIGGAGNDTLVSGGDPGYLGPSVGERLISDSDGSDTYVLRGPNSEDHTVISDGNADGLADVDKLILQDIEYRDLAMAYDDNGNVAIWLVSHFIRNNIFIDKETTATGSNLCIDLIQAGVGTDTATLTPSGIDDVVSLQAELDAAYHGWSLGSPLASAMEAIWQGRSSGAKPGTMGNDLQQGGSGNDILLGGKGGQDTFNGGAGQDTLAAAAGNALFINDDNEADLIVLTDEVQARFEDHRTNASANQDTLALFDWGGGDPDFEVNAADELLIKGPRGGILTLAGWSHAPAGELPGGIHQIQNAGWADTPPITRPMVDRLMELDKLYPNGRQQNWASPYRGLRDSILHGNYANLEATYMKSDKDTVWGLEGNDTLKAAMTDSLMVGGAGNDVLSGTLLRSKVSGGAGNDSLAFNFSSTNNVLEGGAGNDAYVLSSSGYEFNAATIVDSSADGSTNTLRINGYTNGAVYVQDYWFSRPEGTNDLLIFYGSFNGYSKLSATVKDWFDDSVKPISSITLQDGGYNSGPAYASYTRSRDDINQLVQQMAAFHVSNIDQLSGARRDQAVQQFQSFWYQSPAATTTPA
jgi:Ca2+-binding RTX toxin-like protein